MQKNVKDFAVLKIKITPTQVEWRKHYVLIPDHF